MHATARDATQPLDDVELQWDRRVALGVVMAARGYPAEPRDGRPDHRPAGRQRRREGVPCRHRAAATACPSRAGGRVLCVTALGDSTRLAQQRAYEVVHAASAFDGAQYRRDIGQRAIKRCRRSTLNARPRSAHYLLGLQDAHRRGDRSRRRRAVRDRRAGSASRAASSRARASRGCSRAAACSSARGCSFSHVQGPGAAGRRRRSTAARARRRAVRGDGRLAGLPSAQPVRADRAHERAHARGHARRRRARRSGSAAAWT